MFHVPCSKPRGSCVEARYCVIEHPVSIVSDAFTVLFHQPKPSRHSCSSFSARLRTKAFVELSSRVLSENLRTLLLKLHRLCSPDHHLFPSFSTETHHPCLSQSEPFLFSVSYYHDQVTQAGISARPDNRNFEEKELALEDEDRLSNLLASCNSPSS